MGDFRKKVTGLVDAGTISQEEADELLDQATDALTNSVGPAYEAAIAELGEQAKTASTDDGAWKLPDGDAYPHAGALPMRPCARFDRVFPFEPWELDDADWDVLGC